MVALNSAALVLEVVEEEVGMRNPVEAVEVEQYRHIEEEGEAVGVGVSKEGNGNWKAFESNFEEKKEELRLVLVVVVVKGLGGSFD